ncbi:hypothetical protein HWN40_08265 [Methanolobus zinderi]|jgi:hypothetical protein|uniref:Uncharacterized protein n=1 Tax=Methanolobus zinderi TaxID=536044 RepID=A0A7D5EFG1_9EURY|nr:hypothetical protein [Methanolobus zinderi]KXS41607.1 MAG: hypothetical protein AWU59_2025 [Methanolobus sp. T82-4]QLC50234.1 hypothetical protein HWN40_08265 [Methanolobus zinderi]
MRNIKKYVQSYTDTKTDNDIKYIVKGRYNKSVDAEDLELIRFMIGGIAAK